MGWSGITIFARVSCCGYPRQLRWQETAHPAESCLGLSCATTQADCRPYGANIKIVKAPPGPPVIATLVAEVYGKIGQPYEELAQAAVRVRQHMEATQGVVDVDDVLVASEKKLYSEWSAPKPWRRVSATGKLPKAFRGDGWSELRVARIG